MITGFGSASIFASELYGNEAEISFEADVLDALVPLHNDFYDVHMEMAGAISLEDAGIDVLRQALRGSGPQIYQYLRVHSEDNVGTMTYRVPVPQSTLEYFVSVVDGTRIQPRFNPFPVTQIRDSGRSHADSIVIVLLSDGFAEGQLGSWPNPAPGTVFYHADNAITAMTNTHPFGLFEDLFTVYVLHTFGENPNLDPMVIGYLGSIRRIHHPDAGINDYTTSQWTSASLRTNRVLDLVSAVADLSDLNMIQIISNTSLGGAWAWLTNYYFDLSIAVTGFPNLNPESTMWLNTFIHEFGHSFGGLIDEHEHHNFWSEERANSTSVPDANVKWMHWAGHRGVWATPLRYTVGPASGWAVPGNSCIMFHSGNGIFCGVCQAELTRRLAYVAGEMFHGRSLNTFNPLPNTPVITVSEGTTRILDSAFHGNTSLNTITIPASVNTIGDFAFIGATGLQTITNHSTVPQQINYTTFAGVNRANVYLHVPAGTEQAYINAGWTGFRMAGGSTEPLPIQTNRIAAGRVHSIAIDGNNGLYGWGYDFLILHDELSPVKLLDYEIAAVSTLEHTMAITTDGRLFGWGFNWSGQIGDGTTIDRHIPVEIMDNVVSVSVGGSHTMAITADGSLWGWGGGWDNQPERIMDNVVAVSAGIGNALAIKTDGSLWKLNGSGIQPEWVMDNVASVSASIGSDSPCSMIIKTDGSLWRLGGWDNQLEWLMDNVASASASRGWGFHKAAIKTDGSLWIWGCLWSNQPLEWIMDDVIEVSVGGVHTMALRADGSIWTWGSNWHGQIGDGTTITRESPVLIKSH